MTERSDDEGSIRDRLTSRGEDALGKLAQDLLENPLINGAIARAFDAREKAVQAQEVAMGALNLPSAADIERLTRRLRSVSQRLEGIEDTLDRIDRSLPGAGAGIEQRLAGIEARLETLSRQLVDLRGGLPGAQSQIPRAQERLAVERAAAQEAAAPDGPRRARRPRSATAS